MAKDEDSLALALLDDGHDVMPDESRTTYLRWAILHFDNPSVFASETSDHIFNAYSKYVDNVGGLNNYAGDVLQLSSGCKNESTDWRSSLDVNCFSQHLEHSDTEHASTNVAICSRSAKLITSNPPNMVSVHELCNIIEHALRQPVDNTDDASGATNEGHQCEEIMSTVEESSPVHTTSGSTYNGRTRGAPAQLTSELPTKRSHVEPEDPQITNCPFKTAGALLHQYAQSRSTESTSPASSGYGVSKRTLGSRRGPNSRFVPPVMTANKSESLGGIAEATSHQTPVWTSSATSSMRSTECEGADQTDDRLKQFDPKVVDMIISEIMDSKSIVAWDDIAGLEYQKKSLQEVVILPMLRPDLFTGLRGPPKGLLLFGPPGTGKTLIGKCIASQSKSTFFCISASSLTSKWVGEGEKMVRALFTIARIRQPSVIFIDEVDSLLTQRSETEHESSRRIKTEFLVQLDGVSTTGDEHLLFVGATNRPQELDEAARRRFVKRLYVPLPTLEARKQIVRHLLHPHQHTLQATDFDVIAERSDGYSGADMANLCREAAMGPIRALSMEALRSIACDEVRPVALADFMAAFNHVRPSVSTRDLEHYLMWNRQYGSFNACEGKP